MSAERPKPLEFEEWRHVHAPDITGRRAWAAFQDARQGLAGPPELVWEKIFGSTYAASIIPAIAVYFVGGKSNKGACWWFGNYADWMNIENLNDCDSIDDGKRQAHEHFERLWWSMSKPAEEL